MLLRRWGFTGVSAVAARGADGSGWLLELFCDRRTHVLSPAMTTLRLLMGEAVARRRLRRRGHVAREHLEDLDVALQVGLRVEDRQRPLLVARRAS